MEAVHPALLAIFSAVEFVSKASGARVLDAGGGEALHEHAALAVFVNKQHGQSARAGLADGGDGGGVGHDGVFQ